MKKLTVVLAFLILNAFSVVHAQQNKNNSMSIITYYPSPRAVYKTVRFTPNNYVSPDANCANEGEISYNATMHELYVCKGSPTKWKKLGGGTSSANVQYELGMDDDWDEIVTPNRCDDVPLRKSLDGKPMCSTPFYQDIVFPTPFSKPPDVIVSAHHFSGWCNSCSSRGTDKVAAYATDVTNTGFRIWAGGSPLDSECNNGTANNRNYFTCSAAGWIAIGE
jgi:hypothetical protein